MKEKFSLSQLINHCEKSFENADNDLSKLNQTILSIPGMSGNKTRHLYNNICNLQNANYLEIGTWKGSSFISSFFSNEINAVVIDNWSEFQGSKDIFLNNVDQYCPEKPFTYIERDCFLINPNEVVNVNGTIDIYLYDGNHSRESQQKAITHFQDCLSKFSIIIVDDFSYEIVYGGTYEGFEKSSLLVHKEFRRDSFENRSGSQTYWNGVGVFVCEKI